MTSYRLLITAALLLAAFGCSKNETPSSPTTPSCTVTTGAISASTFGAAGGTGSVPVTAASNCAWTSTSSATFLTITAGATGSGNGTASFAVAANTGGARTATLTVSGTSFTISQGAAAPPTPGSLSAPTAVSPVGGQPVTVTRPPLVVNNATATGTVSAVTYRFEISDVSTFPNDDVRTFSVDGVAQGTNTTTGTVNRDLGANVLWYWHARATDGTVTGAYSATETFTTGNPCVYTLSASGATLSSAAGTGSVTVTAASACAWTAVSNDAFISVTGGSAGTGNGTVTFAVTANPGSATRTGTLTIAGNSFTVTQSAPVGLVASFQLIDSASQGGPTTECRFRAPTAVPTTCTLQSTSFTFGANTIVSYAWTVQYTYDSVKTITGTSATQAITDTCGGVSSTADGAAQPLSVTLTVTDNLGATATATSGVGSQAALQVRLYSCGS